MIHEFPAQLQLLPLFDDTQLPRYRFKVAVTVKIQHDIAIFLIAENDFIDCSFYVYGVIGHGISQKGSHTVPLQA